ncbi:hypothetical protein KIPB_011602, partial [Kipferlia bialata]|eukprot:g11602.t1
MSETLTPSTGIGLAQFTQQFRDYLLNHVDTPRLDEIIADMVAEGKRHLPLNLDDVRMYTATRPSIRDLAHDLIHYPYECVPVVNDIIAAEAQQLHPDKAADLQTRPITVSFVNASFGEYVLSPRRLRATHLNKMLCLSGVVTRLSLPTSCLVKQVSLP